jgi:extracellular solute-binding protein (family 3)
MAADLSRTEIEFIYVPVMAAHHFDTIEKGQADFLCEATSQTLARCKQVDFSKHARSARKTIDRASY